MTRKKWLLPLVVLTATAALVAGCGDDDNDTTTTQEAVGATTTGAAELRAGLTAQLQEHVELAGITVVKGVSIGLDSPEFEAAADVLDVNSVDLSESIASVYGDEAGTQFLDLWRKHIGFFVDYTKASAEGDTKAANKAKADLDGYRQDFGAFIASANPELTADAVAEELTGHVDSLFDTIDAVVAGSPDAYQKLQDAAGVMPGTAAVLAGAIVTQMPDQFDGDAASGASELRSGLTALLQQHVYAATIAVDAGLGSGLDSPQFTAAADALDSNSVALSEAIGSVYGDQAGTQFLDLWRKHIGFFVDYTAAKAGGDEKAAAKAKADLDGYRTDFGAFISSANPNLTADAVAEELTGHVNSLFDTIDLAVAGDPGVFAQLRDAAAVMPETAQVLSGAIAEQFPDKFGG